MSVSEPSKITTPWANTGLKNAIPAAADPVTGKAGFDLGFAAINMTAKEAGGVPPFGQDFNGILFSITEVLRYMQAGGRPTFSAAMATAIGGYPKGAVIIGAEGGVCYQNQVDSNMNDPDVNSSGWLPIVANQYPVGAPIPWPTAVPPAGFLAMIGQSFSAVTYPLLALAYPALVIPDMRAEFIRGLDNGRGVDTARAILSAQTSQNRSHNHKFVDTGAACAMDFGTGVATIDGVNVTSNNNFSLGTLTNGGFNAPNTVSDGGTEARPRNIAFNYIVRAA